MSATITDIDYGITGKQFRDTFNANIHALETYYVGDIAITDLPTGLTYAAFIAAINAKFAAISTRINVLTTEYTELTVLTADIVTTINDNFDIIIGLGDAFLIDGYSFFLDVKQSTIPGKGTANILSQQDSWKFGYFTGEDILYISADNGITWPYSIAFADGCDNIRTAWVFKDGSVFVATLQNKIYSSQDSLATLSEVTCMDTDGVTPLAFHEPVNPLYPGTYFASFRGNSFMQDGEEIFMFGTYWHHNNYGAAPINIYRVKDGGADMRVAYHFGQNPDERDDGTLDGGLTGNLLGDAGNDKICKHCHYFTYEPIRGEVWVQVGDDNPTTAFLKGVYVIATDSWTWTHYAMGALSNVFRACGLTFYNGGNNAMWSSDNNGDIYTVTYANLTTALINHTSIYAGTRNLLGLSPYGEKMMAIGGTEQPGTFVISIDYGVTWQEVPTNYMNIIGALTTMNLMRLWEVDSDGYSLVHRANATVPLYAKESYLVKIKNKPVH